MDRLRAYFTTFVIFFMTGVNFSPNAPRSWESIGVVEGNLTTQVIKSAIYLAAFFMICWKWRQSVKLGTRNIFIWLLVLWACASCLWSNEPSITLRRSVGLFGTTLIAVYLASYYDYRQLAIIAARSFLIANVFSLFLILFFPAQGISWYPYGWRGIYYTKNGLGVNALLGIILFASLFLRRKTTVLGMIGLLFSLILLIGSRSVTSIVVLGFALSVWIVLLPLLNKSMPVFYFLLACILLLLIFGSWLYFTNNTDVLFRILGKDPTLTGRVPIWESVFSYIRQKPWVGYGYGAVWLGQDYGIGSYISYPLNYYVVNAHNGYLDLMLEIGSIGVGLAVMVLATLLIRLFSSIRNSAGVKGSELWPVVFLMALILYNSTEAMLLVQNSVAWIFVAFLAFGTPGYQDSRRVVRNTSDGNFSYLPS